jgi:hypothetical protein
MQVTVARFSSPDRVPYDGHGVTPQHLVENTITMMGNEDPQRAGARAVLVGKMKMSSPMLTMPPMD